MFQAIVTETIEGAKSAEVPITVNILDVNDNNPVFPPSGYTVQLAEGEGRRDVLPVSFILSLLSNYRVNSIPTDCTSSALVTYSQDEYNR